MKPKTRLVPPDFSEYVVHFAKNGRPCGADTEANPSAKEIVNMTAQERLISMLMSKKILSTSMPWTKRPAICFTECTWGGMLYHSKRYSPYGIGFTKAYLFSRGGAPAIYLPPGLFQHQRAHAGEQEPFAPELYSFITPFMPGYAPKTYKDRFWRREKPSDFSHEREWRVPHDLDFDFEHISFVVVAKYEDMAKAPKELKDAIGRDKWLIMENYKKIEEFWPTHHIPDPPAPPAK